MSPLTLSVSTFLAVVWLADFASWGHGYGPVAVLGAWYFLGAEFMGRRAWDRVLWLVLAASVFMGAIALFQWGFLPRSRGLFVSPNFLAGYAALHLFLGIHLRHRWIGCSAIFSNLASLLTAGGRGAFLAAGAGFFVLFYRRRPWLASGCMAAALALVAAQYFGRMWGIEEPRIGLWRLGFNIGLERPVLGWGQNAIVLWPLGWTHFYSTPIEWFIASGGLGVAAGAWMLCEAMRASRNQPAMLALFVAWIVNGLFIFDTAATSIPLFTAMALMASEQRREKLVARPVDHNQPLLNRGV